MVLILLYIGGVEIGRLGMLLFNDFNRLDGR